MHETRSTATDPNQIRAVVRDRYAEVSEGQGCCAPGCCATPASPDEVARGLGYGGEQTANVPAGSNLGLGCGNPTAIAGLREGESVLDLGCGAGFDAFLAARAVGPQGHVIGVDMTPEMLQKARANQQRSGHANVEFRLGEIEHLPAADASVDVVISNCVVNLSPEKARVFAEAFRVLKPGGRLQIADIVALQPLPAALRQDLELHAGCVAGAATIAEVQQMLRAAGFTDVRVQPKGELQPVVDAWFPGRGIDGLVASSDIFARKPAHP
jgi:SAM-dependent methyltransferase